jgi:plastocyanin
MEGFLGTGASLWADLNLLFQFTLAMALVAGAYFARRKQYFAHACIQTAVVCLNLFAILWLMLPSFTRQVKPQIPAGLSDKYYSVALAHALVATAAEILGIYVVLAAGTKILPAALRFRSYKPWMRGTILTWWLAALLGFTTYAMWYIIPSSAHLNSENKPASSRLVSVEIRNFRFEPKDLTIDAGATVEWTDVGGRHSIIADDGSFKSEPLKAGERFQHKFDKAGSYAYFCSFHGAVGGHDMAGTITVR